MLIELMKLNNISITELAKELDVPVSRIYKWNKDGINKSDPHWYKLHAKFPALQPKKQRLTKKGIEDKRTTNKRPKASLALTDTDISSYKEPTFKSELFPNIRFKSTK